jgi:hypothetical protein
MPFKSEAQRRFLWAKHPEIAEAWSHGKSSVTGKKEGKARNKGLPMHKRKRKHQNVGDMHRGKFY